MKSTTEKASVSLALSIHLFPLELPILYFSGRQLWLSYQQISLPLAVKMDERIKKSCSHRLENCLFKWVWLTWVSQGVNKKQWTK